MADGGNNTGGIAQVQNVALAMRLLEQTMRREAHLPGLVAFYGPSGLGKTLATAFAAVHHRAYHVEVRSTWTRSDFLRAVLKSMGITAPTKMTLTGMVDEIAKELVCSQRPLLVDEFDFLIKKSTVEVVRDIHEASGGCPIMIIGEEELEKKLRQWDRVHNRVLRWQPAQMANLDDARVLTKLYAPGVDIADDLLETALRSSRQITRRLCINISMFAAYADSEGMDAINLADWGSRGFDSGDAPRRG